MSENAAQLFDEEGKEGRRNSSLLNEEDKDGRKTCMKQIRVVGYDARNCDASNASIRKREIDGIILSSTKPSYCLQRGVGSSQQGAGGESVRSLHRKKLQLLLKKLLLKHNLAEASGVLSVLLKGTARETSISRNRYKYWATLELMRHIKGDTFNPRKIQNVYEQWMKRLGPTRKHSNRSAVQVEFILYCLRHGNIEDAHQAALCLMQERGFASNPFLN